MGFVGTFLSFLIQALIFAIIGRIILSWIDPQQQYRISHVIRDITEPVLMPIRSVMPKTGMLDLSPIIAFLILQLLASLVSSI